MILEKGRSKPIALNTEYTEDSLEGRLTQLCEMKTELRKQQKEFREKTKNLRASIESLENIVTDEVMKMQKTVVVGNIKAEFVPTVKIKLKKEQNDEQ